jgi:assimilatory nitrate reductase catalytic subunit
VRSPRGSIVVRVAADAGLPRGSAWLPMHWGSQFMNSAGVNALTTSARDPFSQQPELKHAAVAVDKADLPWQLVVLRKAGAANWPRSPCSPGPGPARRVRFRQRRALRSPPSRW